VAGGSFGGTALRAESHFDSTSFKSMSEADIALKAETLAAPGSAETVRVASSGGAQARAGFSAKAVSLLQMVFSFPAMLGMALVGRVFYEARAFFVDPDLWWHIKVGQDILATHHWPTVDSYSFTVAGQPWIAYEWLGDVLLAWVEKTGGLLGLEILLFALASVVMLALYAYASMKSGNSKAGFVVAGLMCSLAFASFSLRPQMLGYLFLILVLIVLEKFRQGKNNALWFLPPIFLLWVNTHGSFIIGIGVVVFYVIAGLWEFRAGTIEGSKWTPQQRVRLELGLLLSLAVLPLTPYGAQVAVYPFDMAFGQPINVANIQEWQPMPFNIGGGKLFLVVVVAFFVAQMLMQVTMRVGDAALFFSGFAMACLHRRFLLLFVPFFAPVAAAIIARWLPPYDRKKDHFYLNAAIMAAAAVAIVWYFPKTNDLEKAVGRIYPVQAVEYLRQHPVRGPIFNAYGYGGYLVGKLPEQPVFIDGRGDLYERGGIFGEYIEVSDMKPAAFRILDQHHIEACLLERKDALSTALGAMPGWELRYSDALSALYVRRTAAVADSGQESRRER
jgi:hypothetical protein